VTLNEIKYVQLEPRAFLSDTEVQSWTAKEIGCYCQLIFYLYCNGGKCRFDLQMLARLCNCGRGFARVWDRISTKFTIIDGNVRHKRVDRELQIATERLEKSRASGAKGAKVRWGDHSETNGEPIAKESKGNVIVKESKVNTSNTDTSLKTVSATSSVRALSLNESLIAIIRPVNQSDRTCFRNVCNWVAEQITIGRFDEDIYSRVLDFATEAKHGRNPAAMFMALMKKELEYR